MSNKPNIVWIVSDDTNDGMLGYTGGNMLTPTIDSIARNGVAFTQFHSVAPACGPSRYSYLTGHFPGRSPHEELQTTEQYMLFFNAYLYPDKEQSVGHVMRQVGYRTGFVGKWHVGASREDLDAMVAFQPDDDPRDPEVNRKLARQQEQLCAIVRKAGFDYAHSVLWGNHESLPPKAQNHNIEWITKGGLDFIGQSVEAEKPFFLAMAPTTIHDPDHASSMLADPRHTGGGWSDDHIGCQASRQSVYDRLHAARIEYNSTTVGALWMDDAVAAIMDRLRALGILDHTVVIFSTDHGPSVGGKFTTYQRGVRIPFAAQWPGRFPAGTTCDDLAQNVDLLPTLLAIAGVPPPDGMILDGKSLLPLLTGATTRLAARDDLYFEFGYTRSVRTRKWKYIAWRLPESVITELQTGTHMLDHCNRSIKPGEIPNTLIMGSMLCYPHFFEPDQLYDLENDPFETANLARDEGHAPVLAEMKARLKKYLDMFFAPFPLDRVDRFMESETYRDRSARFMKTIHDAEEVWIKHKKAEGYYYTEKGVAKTCS